MFDNGLWALIGIFFAFFLGKERGEKKTVERYESMQVIKNQQDQIAILNKKLDELINKVNI